MIESIEMSPSSCSTGFLTRRVAKELEGRP